MVNKISSLLRVGGIRKEPHSLEVGLSGAPLGVGFKPFPQGGSALTCPCLLE